MNSDNTYILVSIRKKRVKEDVNYKDLQKLLLKFMNMNGCKHHSTGYHIMGRYRQLHSHSIVEKVIDPLWMQILFDTDFYVDFRKFPPCDYRKVYRYIHSEDRDFQWLKNDIKILGQFKNYAFF